MALISSGIEDVSR
jgi:hypothetical protein